MWAVIPVKDLVNAKQRLATVLGLEERRRLFRAMLEDVLDAASAARGLAGVAVVTRDTEIVALARARGARVIVEQENRGQSAAVARAGRVLAAEGAAGMLTLPGDVPLVTAAEIEAVLAGHGQAPAFSIVPARDGRGSNCVAVSPADAIAFHFGDDSFAPHLGEARKLGVEARTLALPGIGLDVDAPDDLAAVVTAGPRGATAAFLVASGIASRLGRRPDRDAALRLVEAADAAALMAAAAAVRDMGHGDIVTYSRKVFIPLTHLCRDVCHYCTFAHPPRRGMRAYLTPEEVLTVARAGADAGCKEALFTLGDKPEARYAQARRELSLLGHATTLSYLHEMAGRVLAETGLLPHLNPGVMTADDIAALRRVSVSQGLMLESASPRLGERGGPHFGSPDKEPAARLATIAAAGEARVPFTTGILIGIGETRRERVEALLAIRDAHDRHGHIQEIIVQNFRAKLGTRMAFWPEPALDELAWTVAVARLLFGPAMNIQAPPNLSPGGLARLIEAGINDWGGVSPLTPDHVNPEAPWPHLDDLAQQTAAAGKTLGERLALYPAYVRAGEVWLDAALRAPVLRAADADGLAREDDWMPGARVPAPALVTSRKPGGRPGLDAVLARAQAGDTLDEDDIVRLFAARGPAFDDVVAAADATRAKVNGDIVTYVVNRNINYTNICTFRCRFCAFSKGKLSDDLRGRPYDLGTDEIERRAREAWQRGATEVCMQGGIHPDYDGSTYVDICRHVRAAVPGIHVHAFSPLEVWQGATTLGLGVPEFLARLKDAGLGTLPGTAAEVLDDEVRAIICPDKLSTAQWLAVMRAAHGTGFLTTATIMFGHVDGARHWARHLLAVRRLQDETGGFTEFVPLPFVAMEAPIYLKGAARRGPTFRESLLMHAVARLALHPLIANVQASWVKMGPDGAAACLRVGANDLGGTLMNESITRAAGAAHGQEMPPERMEEVIRAAGRVPRQRTTTYAPAPAERVSASFAAAPLAPVVQTPPAPTRRKRAGQVPCGIGF